MKFPKHQKIRSKKIRDSARGETCTFRIPGVCNNNDETVVFCHAPSPHKGTATKSDDFWGAYGCHNCHSYMDNYRYGQVSTTWMQAIFETQKRLIEKGLIEVKK